MHTLLATPQSANFKNLVKLSIPLIITSLSGSIMIFLDRVILANYSTSAMHAVASAGLSGMMFIFGAISIASISEVFVGQYNGAKQYEKLASPVWQMLIFCLALMLIYVPCALLLGPLCIPESLHEHGIPYFKWFLGFGCLMPMTAALSGFFAGIGKAKIISIAAIVGNIVNLVLDFPLIFGWYGIPELGAEGAAISTVIGQFVQLFIIAYAFLNNTNNKKYQTRKISWNKEILLSCLKLGYPNAVGHSIEIIGWSFLYYFVAGFGTTQITALTMGQNIFFLFAFLSEGVQKGIISIASNLIGAKDTKSIKRLFRSAFKLHGIILACISIPILFVPESLLYIFNMTDPSQSQLAKEAILSFRCVWLYIAFDGLVWIFAGILTAGGDTRFIMWANAITIWLFAILPIYLVMKYVSDDSVVIWGLSVVYAFINMLIFYHRYKKGYWKNSVITN